MKNHKRTTKRNIIETSNNLNRPLVYHDVEKIVIGEFIPKGEKKPTQVHLLIYLKGNPTPQVMRFKSPDTLGDLIAELSASRDRVWKDAEPVDFEAAVKEKDDLSN